MAHILLAEDDSSMRHFIQKALEKAGHSVDAEADGLAALLTLQNKANYDLLLTDIVMPGIDGIELSQKAMKLCPSLKVMFITGFAAVAMDSKDKKPQGTKILSKPFHLNDLVQQVESLLKAA
jgi:two-component system cell cycle response regulator CpdR